VCESGTVTVVSESPGVHTLRVGRDKFYMVAGIAQTIENTKT
jgi:hypothetical protein